MAVPRQTERSLPLVKVRIAPMLPLEPTPQRLEERLWKFAGSSTRDVAAIIGGVTARVSLNVIVRHDMVSRACQTSPMPPSPILAETSYTPRRVPGLRAMSCWGDRVISTLKRSTAPAAAQNGPHRPTFGSSRARLLAVPDEQPEPDETGKG